MSSVSPGFSRRTIVPSTCKAGAPLPSASASAIGSEAEITAGREMPDIGATGLTITASSIGDTSGPPAAYEYAVDPIGVAMTRASQRYRPLPRPITVSDASTAPSPGTLARTTSLNAIDSSPPSRSTAAVCSSTVKSPASSRSSAASSSCGSTSTRNPRFPRFTPRIGTGRSATRRNAPSIVPSPPRLINASASPASWASLTGSTSAGKRGASRASAITCLPCDRAQLVSFSATGAGSLSGCRTSPSRPTPSIVGMGSSLPRRRPERGRELVERLVLGVADLLPADAEEAALLVRARRRLRGGHHELLVRVDLLGGRLCLEDSDSRAQVVGHDRRVPGRLADLVRRGRGRRLDQLVEQFALAGALARLLVDAAQGDALPQRPATLRADHAQAR